MFEMGQPSCPGEQASFFRFELGTYCTYLASTCISHGHFGTIDHHSHLRRVKTPHLGRWTSMKSSYLFGCSLGLQVLTHSHFVTSTHIYHVLGSWNPLRHLHLTYPVLEGTSNQPKLPIHQRITGHIPPGSPAPLLSLGFYLLYRDLSDESTGCSQQICLNPKPLLTIIKQTWLSWTIIIHH